jgi:hypothetical protein
MNKKFSVIDGVSARTMGEIRRWERAHRLPGVVALALEWWRGAAAFMCSRRFRGGDVGTSYYGDYGCECCAYWTSEGREGLERVLHALSRRGRRELRAVVHRIDARVLAATHGAEPEAPHWWERRC